MHSVTANSQRARVQRERAAWPRPRARARAQWRARQRQEQWWSLCVAKFDGNPRCGPSAFYRDLLENTAILRLRGFSAWQISPRRQEARASCVFPPGVTALPHAGASSGSGPEQRQREKERETDFSWNAFDMSCSLRVMSQLCNLNLPSSSSIWAEMKSGRNGEDKAA